jgi:glycosyltransferase involved in cell wall biosynthesis
MIEEGTDALVSVIVCTRNRAGIILNVTNSVLASNYARFELLIVDESDDNSTADVIAPLLHQDSRLRYLRLTGTGKARALNHALPHARGQYLALTDDDCEMAPDCLSAFVAAFEADPHLAIIFGDVQPVSEKTEGYIPDCTVRETKTISRPADFLKIRIRRGEGWNNFGIGANMAIRAAAVRNIEGWDSFLGPGEKFGSGDDHDLAFRLLRCGYSVHFAPGARVVHHGIRPRNGMRHYARRIGRGFGASCIKHLKCGGFYRGSTRVMTIHLVRFCYESLRGRKSDGAFFVVGWWSGFFGGLWHPVDRRARVFQNNHSASR